MDNKCEEESDKRPQFGNRFLVNEDEVFEHNAWDDVQWNEEQEAEARNRVSLNSRVTMSEEQVEQYESEANKHWNTFYGIHANRFFKDRQWLFTEFPELHFEGKDEAAKVLEIGCGVGNTIFPILQYAKNPNLMVYASDFSSQAIALLKEHPDYNAHRCNAFVLDATEEMWNVPFEPASLDVAVLIFVLSSINPNRFQHIANQLYKYLKPGGLLLFRDYGRYDLAQLRFKPGKCLKENFYVRGDGTRVYFFTQEEVREIFTKSGFTEEENRADRRLQVNRGRLLKMYRVWVQAKYKKPCT